MKTIRLQIIVLIAAILFTVVVMVNCAPCQVLVQSTESDTIRQEREQAAHPERWGTFNGQVYWFHLTPAGERSMRRPGVKMLGKKPESITRWERQVRAHNEAVTGKKFKFSWEK